MGQEVRGVPPNAALSRAAAAAAPGGEAAPKAPAAPEPGIGGYLASQRKLRGISLDELASLTKIPRRSLERLESGAFDIHPDGFVRGFVRTVAAALGLDPDESVMRLLREPDSEADEAPPLAPVAGTRLVRAAAVALAVAVLAVLVWLVVVWRSAPPDLEAPPLVLRRDPVRELATEAAPAPPEPEAGRP